MDNAHSFYLETCTCLELLLKQFFFKSYCIFTTLTLPLLEEFQELFTWQKRELGQCLIGEHSIGTQGLPPCHITLERLSYWEEVEVN
jgi:hypothetical protein